MYKKNYLILFMMNIAFAWMMIMTRRYLPDEKQVAEAFLAIENSVHEMIEERSRISIGGTAEYQRNVTYEIIQPAYVITVSQKDIEILMRIVEAEAGGEDKTGKLLVANVIINRVKSGKFPDTVEKVVYQKTNHVTQFSPVSDGRIDKVEISEDTQEVVYSALRGEDESKGALYFVARKIADPDRLRWFDNNLTLLFSHGGHDFFL